MKILFLADIHANYSALEAVMEKAQKLGFDKMIVLGDFIGYGCDVCEVIDFFRTQDKAGKLLGAILGNHDNAVLNRDGYSDFNSLARWVVEWTKEVLSEEMKSFLKGFQDYVYYPELNMVICHGSLVDRSEYVNLIYQAKANFKIMTDKLIKFCFFGHTHVPVIFSFDGATAEKMQVSQSEFSYVLAPEVYYMINPGSVGQPRDGNPMASFLIYDTEMKKVNFYRVSYNLSEFQTRLRQNSFPEKLIQRLEVGR